MSWLVLASGANGEPWWIALIKSVIIINLVLFGFAYLTLIERKVMGRMQLRYGPNRAGPWGLMQPIADLVKLIRKESFFPAAAIDGLYIIAPFLAAFTALTTFSVIPWGPGWEIAGYQVNGYIADLPVALLLIFAARSLPPSVSSGKRPFLGSTSNDVRRAASPLWLASAQCPMPILLLLISS